MWAKDFKGKAGKLNDKFSVHFGDDTYVILKSLKLYRKRNHWLVRLHLGWIEDKKEWKNNEVIWTLTEKNGKTQIDFVHKGMTPESECYESCKPGWTHHIKDSLLKLINEGKGFPE